MCMHMHICMHPNVYTCIYMYPNVCVHTPTLIYTCSNMSTHVLVPTCIRCVHVCTCVYTYPTCMCTYLHVPTYMCARVCMYLNLCIQVHVYPQWRLTQQDRPLLSLLRCFLSCPSKTQGVASHEWSLTFAQCLLAEAGAVHRRRYPPCAALMGQSPSSKGRDHSKQVGRALQAEPGSEACVLQGGGLALARRPLWPGVQQALSSSSVVPSRGLCWAGPCRALPALASALSGVAGVG